ncbi:unnamed protein product, partial [Prorocentrum cordatum]
SRFQPGFSLSPCFWTPAGRTRGARGIWDARGCPTWVAAAVALLPLVAGGGAPAAAAARAAAAAGARSGRRRVRGAAPRVCVGCSGARHGAVPGDGGAGGPPCWRSEAAAAARPWGSCRAGVGGPRGARRRPRSTSARCRGRRGRPRP